MLVPGDDSIVRRYADGMERRANAHVVLRPISRPGVLPNPPTLTSPVIDGAVASGATTLSLRAAQAVGRLIPGDILILASGARLTVAAQANARLPGLPPNPIGTPGFTAITLTTPCPVSLADGAPVVPRWLADKVLPAFLTDHMVSLRDTGILAGDVSVTLAAYGRTAPLTSDQIIIDGRPRTIVSVAPVHHMGVIGAWRLHAR